MEPVSPARVGTSQRAKRRVVAERVRSLEAAAQLPLADTTALFLRHAPLPPPPLQLQQAPAPAAPESPLTRPSRSKPATADPLARAHLAASQLDPLVAALNEEL
jgi:hypothetical protein